MLLHSRAAAVARVFPCAAPHRPVLTCCLHSRCSLEGSTSHTPWHGVQRSITYLQHRWCWSGQQHDLTRIHRRHQVLHWVTGTGIAPYCTSNTNTQHSYTTSKAGESEETPDTGPDEADFKALVELEVELYRQEGFTVPSKFTPTQWQELLTYRSITGRKKYITFLFKNEMKSENQRKIKEINRIKREEERQKRENELQQDSEGHIEYGLFKNSLFLKILDSSMTHFYHCNVVQAMLYGQPLVVDLGFEEHMSKRERQNCAFQIQMMMSANRKHQDPYSLELHNAPPTLDLMTRLERYIPPLYKPEFPLLINPGSYLEKYPREQLVYLTPHCQEELLVYDHNAVYIIGGIVDKSSGEPLTLAKAKREGIRMQKLPLERYLSWGVGRKTLTLNQIVSIMLDMKLTGDWHQALSHVPTRKLQLPPQSQQAREEALLRKIQSRDRR